MTQIRSSGEGQRPEAIDRSWNGVGCRSIRQTNGRGETDEANPIATGVVTGPVEQKAPTGAVARHLSPSPEGRTHPADAMAHNLFGRTALDAIRLGECIRCAETVTPDAWPEADRREYFITALCPTCWSVLFPEEDDDE